MVEGLIYSWKKCIVLKALSFIRFKPVGLCSGIDEYLSKYFCVSSMAQFTLAT